MPTLLCNFAALMVAGLFYSWRAYSVGQVRRLRTLRERVAYMLWMMAQTIDASAAPEPCIAGNASGNAAANAAADHAHDAGLTAARS